ncbi:hypothetical protein NUM_09250 [Actinocatenispora comari]|uniref:Uncharacterized protein n=1 Tax=Actinocatenispora comari TaxID=2807577 RepID=A0A8J4EIV8_9ACTN|nr:hypothetical protein NUM_09250 [Actinocatenispora comari]
MSGRGGALAGTPPGPASATGRMPTAWLLDARITRGTPASRAASSTVRVPSTLTARICSHGASRLMPPRWITAAAPRHAAVIAAGSVTDAVTSSIRSPGPAGG